MIIKEAASRDADVTELERLLDRPDVPEATRKRIEAEVRQIQSGIKGEQDAAYLIDLYFGRSPNWAIIHDLRIEVDGHAAQIDHLIVNRLVQVWVCESKHFAEGVSVNEHGEWSRWWRGRSEGMASPIEQARRHILLLERAFEDGLVASPKRLGLVRWKPEIRSVILVSDNARIGRPKQKVDGLETVFKAERLKQYLFAEFEKAPAAKAFGLIGKEGLEAFVRRLAGLHRPISWDWAARFGLQAEPAPVAVIPESPSLTAPATPVTRRPWFVKFDGPCANCGVVLREGTEAVWQHRQRRVLCLDCAASTGER
jgi:hypothetical protein